MQERLMDQTGNGARPQSLKAGDSRRDLDWPPAALARGGVLASLVAAETEAKKGKKKSWTHQTSFGSEGSGASEFKSPSSVFVASGDTTAFVADSGNSRISVWTRSSPTSTDWANQTTFGSPT